MPRSGPGPIDRLAVDLDVAGVGSSSPATMLSSVDLPQPDDADEAHELAVGDLEVDAVDGQRPSRFCGGTP